jgi:hypothetical protein
MLERSMPCFAISYSVCNKQFVVTVPGKWRMMECNRMSNKQNITFNYKPESRGFDSRRYQIFWEVVGLERGPLSLVSTIEGLLGRKSSSSCLEIREYGRRGSITLTTWPQELALTSPTSGGRSVGIVRSRTQATKFIFPLISLPFTLPYLYLIFFYRRKLFHIHVSAAIKINFRRFVVLQLS